MPELVAAFESAGHEAVTSYIQSGNVIFRSPDRSASRVAAALEHTISSRFGLEVKVMLRTHKELEKIASGSPFEEHVHVVFLDRVPARKAVQALDPLRSPGDSFEVAGREIYLCLPNGAGRTKLTLDWLERTLEVTGTQRNWNTLLRLVELTAN